MSDVTSPRDDRIVELLTGVQQELTRYVRTLVPNRSDAEEVLQETNLFIWRHSDQYALGTNFTAWAYSIAHYQVLTYRKHHARSRLCFSDALVEQLASSPVEVNQPPGQRRGLRGLVAKLSEQDRLLVDCGRAGRTVQSVAEKVGRSTRRSTPPWGHPHVAAGVHAAVALEKEEGMMGSESKLFELADLLTRLCDSELDQREWERLDALLCDDAEAQEFYRRFIALDVDLASRGAAPRHVCHPKRQCGSSSPAKRHRRSAIPLPCRGSSDRRCPSSSRLDALSRLLLVVRQPDVLVRRCRVDLGGWDRRCLAMGSGCRFATDCPKSRLPPVETAAYSGPVIVGTITGMSNCRWADPCVAARVADPVPQGRKYSMTAGLLEITYNTGGG